MTTGIDKDYITSEIYECSKEWVSVEVKLTQQLDPITLFQLTDKHRGDRFYMRLNDNQTSYFGYAAVKIFKNNFKNKQSIFREWEKVKEDVALINPSETKHHLRIVGGFQFSSHKSDDEWREFGLNHFVLPQVLISIDHNDCYLTYTVKRNDFDIEQFSELVDRFNGLEKKPLDITIGNITRIEDIYKEDWRQLVSEAIDAMNKDEKIVLARRRLIKYDRDISIPFILNQALSKEKNSYIFLLESDDSIFFSQTPEQLLKIRNQVLSTKAVAGTIKRTHDEEEDQQHIAAFLKDNKNLNEHQFVVDSILHDIKPYVTDINYDQSPKILKNDYLYHLYTEIKAPLKQASYSGLIDNLHPTPALGGYPKEQALDFIEQKEFGTRGLYGAPVGFIDLYNDCEFIVAIRSMLIKQNQATLFAGCGIVKDSNADSEVEETNLKFSPMMKALGVDMSDKS
ncbi:isochorismate synthase [Staphylococcus simiae]|uniref:isochorismate synthase n=1 Tax=Staphylococcus simiae CCM 7213 = CCUG 51256 TaxID=911238 RepID=G5JHB4_9STAP|nr:isochorismate synthase [Staphylococcus simiae]EHJ08462.1 isochorismate synthase [Staphylococcus simiae CCM 7213 = CCUG 51256]SNV67654.1 putative chorismate binding enzyme [Staphylococcus simiae]